MFFAKNQPEENGFLLKAIKKMIKKFLGFFQRGVGIDLGTANCKIYLQNKGLVLIEPSVVAINKKTGKMLAVGNEAKKMVGKTPAHISAIRPLRNGVVSDFEATELMIRYFLQTTKGKFLFSPLLVIAIPCGLTEVEKRAVLEAGKSAGGREVFLIEEPFAAAVGANLPVEEAMGNLIIDIGGGTSEIAVISLGGIVLARVLRLAGDKLNEDIVEYIQQRYKLAIGERTAEEAKIAIGSVLPLKEEKTFTLRGRNMVSGLPQEIVVPAEEIRKAMEKTVRQIIHEIRAVIDETPPELIADIIKNGIYLSGGGSLLGGLDVLIQKETGLKTQRVPDPIIAVVKGVGKVLEEIKNYKNVLLEESEFED